MEKNHGTKCNRCGSVMNVSSRYVACGSKSCWKSEPASIKVKWYNDDIEVWLIYLCSKCFKGAGEDFLTSKQVLAKKYLPFALILAFCGIGLGFLTGFKSSNAIVNIVIVFSMLGGALFSISFGWEYTKARYKLRRLRSSDSHQRISFKEAFEGEARRLLNAPASLGYPKPKMNNRNVVLIDQEYDIVGVAESAGDLVANLDVNWRWIFDAKSKGSSTPLIEASFRGDILTVTDLVAKGTNINEKHKNGSSALNAALLGNANWVEFSDKDLLSIISLLIENGADVNIPASNGCTPLHTAAILGTAVGAKILLASKADPNSCAEEGGMTPLMAAVEANKAELVSLLIESGADVNAISNDGKTAMTFAIDNGYSEVQELLRSHV